MGCFNRVKRSSNSGLTSQPVRFFALWLVPMAPGCTGLAACLAAKPTAVMWWDATFYGSLLSLKCPILTGLHMHRILPCPPNRIRGLVCTAAGVSEGAGLSLVAQVVKLSDAVQPLPRQTTAFVHGVPHSFIKVGEEKAQPPPEGQRRFDNGAYFIGKVSPCAFSHAACCSWQHTQDIIQIHLPCTESKRLRRL